jgi:hypothetical protein
MTARRAMVLMATLFFVKAAALGLYVTPLWDVPDEPAHYAYTADIAEGRGLPMPGASVLPADVARSWLGKDAASPVPNWLAGNPPIPYLLEAPVLAAVELSTDSLPARVRALRLCDAAAGALVLLVLFQVLWEATGDGLMSFAGASAVGFVPMFTHLSSGLGNDVLTALAASVAALYYVRLCRDGRLRDAVKMGLALSVAGAVKLTAVPLAAGLVAMSWRRLPGRGAARAARAGALAVVSLLLPALWAGRIWWRLAYSARTSAAAALRPGAFLEYLRDNPVVDHTFKNFFGLIGWTGTGRGHVRWFQISGVHLLPFLLLALALLAAAGVRSARQVRLPGGGLHPGRALGAALAAAVFLAAWFWLFPALEGVALLKRLVYALLLAVPFAAVAEPLEDPPFPTSVFAGSLFGFLVFGIFDLLNSWQAFQFAGRMRATHGRYFFAVLPLLLLAFAAPLSEGRDRRRRNAILAAVLAGLCANEAAFFVHQVIPFYRGG